MSFLKKNSDEIYCLRICSEDIVEIIQDTIINTDYQCLDKKSFTIILQENAQLLLIENSKDSIQKGQYFSPRFMLSNEIRVNSIADL